MHRGCFKRFRFERCKDCEGVPVSLWHRIRCYSRYLCWHTDPIPTETILGWISMIWTASVSLHEACDLPRHFITMWEVMPRKLWIPLMMALGAVQVFTPMFGTIPWVRKIRLTTAFVSAIVWSVMAYATIMKSGVLPFTGSCAVFAGAAWWVFLRSGDGAPGTCRYPDCRRPRK